MQDYNVLVTDESYKETVEFWRQRLSFVNGRFRLPATDSKDNSGTRTIHSFDFSQQATNVLRRFANDDLGRFTIVTAAIGYVLARYGGQSTSILNTQPLVTSTAHAQSALLPIILNLDGDWTVGRFLQEAAEVISGTVSSDGFPLDAFLERDYNLEVDSVTNVYICDEHLHRESSTRSGADIAICLNTGICKTNQIKFNADRIEPYLISAFGTQVNRVLEQFDDVGRKLSTIELLSNEEKLELTVDFNSTKVDRPRKTVVDLFEGQVEQTPETPALAYQDRKVTYRSLNSQANKLARYLLEHCRSESNSTVGIMMNRSPEMIVAVLAALKAGMAYVPIDPEYPVDRINHILTDAAISLLITQSDYIAELQDFNGQLFAIDHQLSGLTNSEENLSEKPDSNAIAYILYTSGSTGIPKGCQVEHGNLSNYLRWATSYYFNDSAIGNFGLYSSLSFDFTITNIFCPLLRGRSLVIFDQKEEIHQILERAFTVGSGIDTMKLTPSHIRLLEEGNFAETDIRKVIAGGEELRIKHVRALKKIDPSIEIYNEYGPTEATVGCIVKKIESSDSEILIGRPIDNTRIYIVDAHNRLVPIGIRGEICISGDSVARGYNNRPDLTSEKFINNPFENDGLLYRTGDIGRWLPDGNIQCFGRTDDQVKIRGFRVELGEIENILLQHPDVNQAVVVARENHSGEKRLIAYIVGTDSLTVATLREFAQTKLPPSMAPAFFVLLDRFPLNANGKVDRESLPSPEQIAKDKSRSQAAPTTELEAGLLLIWRDILRSERIGVTDNFFELGGDSLTAVQLISHVWSQLGIEIQIDDVFESPTITGLARHISKSEKGQIYSVKSKISAATGTGRIPLSFSQQRLWFLDQLEPGGAAYNIPAAIRLSGALDINALERALNLIIQRHQILRTRFDSIDGWPFQIIEPQFELTLLVTDVACSDGDEREQEILARATIEAKTGFDLTHDPLVRAGLLRLSENEHVLLLTMHHIVTDEWSTQIFTQEMALAYEAFCRGESPALGDLPIQYADFANWQMQWLNSEELGNQLDYWRKQLSGMPPLLEIPTKGPRPAIQSYNGATLDFVISGDTHEKLNELSKCEGVTLFMTLLAAFDVLLHRYSGQKDIVVGSPVANRNRTEIESLIGFFTNTLVLRSDLGANPTFRELLGRVRGMALAAYAHQDLPFEKLVDELQPERNLRHTPLFQVCFVFQNTPRAVFELPFLTITPIGIEAGTSKFDLTLTMDASDILTGSIEYNIDLFDGSTILRMAEHFRSLLESTVANPDTQISDLSIIGEAEERKLLYEWNPENVILESRCLHELFESAVKNNPSATAVVVEQQRLAYQELNQRANQLAHYLRSLGAGPETPIALYLDRSLEMIVAIVAVLKSGAAYLPLEIAYPKQRVSFMLEDSRTPILLTVTSLRESLPQHKARTICLDSEWPIIGEFSDENVHSQSNPGNAAYIIYTSGSTGSPKGVTVTHHNVARLFEATRKQFHFDQNDVWTMFHSYAFDFSVWEIWGALLHGGRLIVVPYWMSRSPDAFYDLLISEKVTVLNQTPSAFRQLIPVNESKEAKSPLALRTIIFGGEALELQSLRPWLIRHGDRQPESINMYGITETTVHVSYRQITLDDLETKKGSVIGGPMSDLQIYLLDENLNLCPIGVRGEMYVGGDGLARGYLGREGLTAERFIPNPFSNRPGERLYRTGDLARRLENGDLEYLGRIDQQVKIRGFRIELGEIEEILNRHPLVRESVVTAREDLPGDKRLVAYVVSNQSQPSHELLRHYLKVHLPEYMIPVIVRLESLPLTTNGKIDRGALPDPGMPVSEVAHVSPRNVNEQILVKVWSEVLGIERVGVNDNFFELGGDSILSVQVIARARKAGLGLTTQQIFQHQTIEELATVASGEIFEAEQGLVIGEFPLTPVQHWFFEHKSGTENYFNQSVLLETPPDLTRNTLNKVIEHLVLHHDALRTRIHRDETKWVQSISSGIGIADCEYHDLTINIAGSYEEVIESVANRLQSSLDIYAGPVIRTAYFNFGPTESGRLLLIVHHIAIDGVSWRILIEDLVTIYDQLSRGDEIALPLKTTSFKEWSWRLQSLAKSSDLAEELTFWASPKRTEVKPLPLDANSGATDNTIADIEIFKSVFDVVQTRSLLETSQRYQKAQANEVLITALAVSLQEWTGSESILIDLEGHGREELFDKIDISRTVGWFTTVFPALFEMSGVSTADDALASIRSQKKAMPRQGIGYGLLRYCSNDSQIESQLTALPRAQVVFNYLGQTDQLLHSYKGWKLASESTGSEQDPNGRRPHLIEINAIVVDGQLQVEWVYNSRLHFRETIAGLADSFNRTVLTLIASVSPEISRQLEKIPQSMRADVEDIYPLSPLQSGMLFKHAFEPESGAYFEQLSCIIDGPLNIDLFRRAWQCAVDRHSVLRTVFIWEASEQPLQVVLRSTELPWDIQDWTNLDSNFQIDKLERFFKGDRNRRFDLKAAPAFRLTLIKLREDHHCFCFSNHHIVIDGWSTANLLHEVMTFYATGGQPDLPEIRPYRSYIDWIQSRDLSAAENYWHGHLKGFTSPTKLPYDGYQSSEKNYSAEELILSEKLSSDLRAVVQRNHLTINTLIRGVWAILLSRYSNQSEVCFGVTLAGRPAALDGVEDMIGLFINTLPLRVTTPENEPLTSWLRQLQHLHAPMEQYSYASLADTQRWAGVPAGARLFDSILVFENYPVDQSLGNDIGDLKFSGRRVSEQTEFPLTLAVDSDRNLLINILYDADLFNSVTIRRMLSHFETAFKSFVADPDQNVGDIQILADAERRQLLDEWNQTGCDTDSTRCIHELFEQHAERSPDAPALIFLNQELTYGELNKKANQLANYLRDLGVGPETLVAVCMGRSVELIVGILGVLKAGGAYVPLDPAYPRDRISFMLQDADVKVLLTQRELATAIKQVGIKAVCLNDHWDHIAEFNDLNLSHNSQPENLAYVIYTSGSTGRPKGVMIAHQSLVSYIGAISKRYEFCQRDRLLQVASISFDTSVEDIFCCFAAGATLVLRTDAMIGSASSFLAECRERRITVLNLPTAYWHALVAGAAAKEWTDLDTLRLVILGGEKVIADRWREWQQEIGIRIANSYGPTETTVCAAVWESDDCGRTPNLAEIPIGRPIENVRIYLLDDNLELAPIGAAGHLHIGGLNLVRGYLDGPKLTAEKFIPDPFSPVPGARLYRSGDLARYRSDGVIEFVGRVDEQVKIRGYRVEVGEIESALRQHQDLLHAVVTIREDTPGEKRLVAYVVARQPDNFSVNKLRDFLKDRLPDYMIPSAIVSIGELPLTVNGKIDRDALPEPTEWLKPSSEIFVPPRDETERKLVHIWQETLRINGISVKDDFFEMGGHSILAVKLVGRIQAEFQTKLPLAKLYENSTIERLANALRDPNAAVEWQTLIRMQRGGSGTAVFLFPGAGGNILYFYELAKHLGRHRPVYALQAVGLDGVTPPFASIADIARHNIKHIKAAQPHGPYILAGHSFGGAVAFEMSQQLRAAGDEVELLAILDTAAPVFIPTIERADWDDARWLKQIAEEIEEYLKIDLSITIEDLQNLPEKELLDYVMERIQQVGWWPPGWDRTQLRGYLQVFKANFKSNYVISGKTLPVPIALFKSSDGRGETANIELDLLLKERFWGWDRFSSVDVTVYDIPGDHLTMLADGNAAILAERMAERLGQVRADLQKAAASL